MTDTKQDSWEIDGFTYKLLTAEDVLRSSGQRFVINQSDENAKIGEKRVRMSDEHEGWVEEGENTTVDKSQEYLRQIQGLNDEFGGTIGRRGGNDHLNLDGDSFYNWQNGSLRDMAAMVTFRDGQMVGFLSMKPGKGYIDKGIVRGDYRKSEQTDGQPQVPVSEHLMQLTIASLIAKYGNERIWCEPISIPGEKYTQNNGFKENKQLLGENKNTIYELDPRIIEAAKKIIAENSKETDETALIREIESELRPKVKEIVAERMAELHGERQLK